jgi:hypothetical protein
MHPDTSAMQNPPLCMQNAPQMDQCLDEDENKGGLPPSLSLRFLQRQGGDSDFLSEAQQLTLGADPPGCQHD